MPVAYFAHDHALGTAVGVRVEGANESDAARVDAAVMSELLRLERIFSVFDSASELRRWGRGEVLELSSELRDGLELALEWVERTDGAFNPMVGEIVERWQQAEECHLPPDASELAELAATIRHPRFSMQRGGAVRLGDCSRINLNALAKGLIVDRALAKGSMVATEIGATSVVVNAGGDLAHVGTTPIRVGIENPLRPYDNEPALCEIEVRNAAVASSGNARRGYTIAGTRYGHVIDPRTGWPANELASVAVVAPCAATADVLATSTSVRSCDAAIAHLESFPGVSGFVVGLDGTTAATMDWLSD